MSPRFYQMLWIITGVSAGVLWLAGMFTMMAVVVYGFIAFGLTFTGMMCVLPGVVSHHHEVEVNADPILVEPKVRKAPAKAVPHYGVRHA